MGGVVVQRGYGSVTLPNDLLESIDDFLRTNRQGYKTRPEVVKVAVRAFITDNQARPPNS